MKQKKNQQNLNMSYLYKQKSNINKLIKLIKLSKNIYNIKLKEKIKKILFNLFNFQDPINFLFFCC